MQADHTDQSGVWTLDQLQQTIGLGVAGNFAGHLEQAGEASDFVNVQAEVGAPKGVFPFYVPTVARAYDRAQLANFPVSSTQTLLPKTFDGGFQVEPEVGLLCALTYDGDQVSSITPKWLGAFNDCSHRVEGASKISDKKNWGPASKGFSVDQLWPIDRFDGTGITGRLRLASFLKRDGRVHAYGEDSALASYGYMHDQLLVWLQDKLNQQQDHGPLEAMPNALAAAGKPAWALVAIGATRYTDFGETDRLQPGDTTHVVVYDPSLCSAEALQDALAADEGEDALRIDGALVLKQTVATQS